MFLQLLSKSLDQVQDEDWFAELGASLIGHMTSYEKHPQDKVTPVSFHQPPHPTPQFSNTLTREYCRATLTLLLSLTLCPLLHAA